MFIQTIVIVSIIIIFSILYSILISLNQKTPCPKGFDITPLNCSHCNNTSCQYSKEQLTEIKESIQKDLD